MMANHGFISFKEAIDGERMIALLNEISQKRFGGLIKIEHEENGWNGRPTASIEIYKGLKRLFWLTYPTMIEHRHGPGGWLAWYIELVFANDLALALDGTLSDEGHSEKWGGKENLYPTFEEFLLECRSHRSNFLIAFFNWLATKADLREAEQLRPDLKKWIRK